MMDTDSSAFEYFPGDDLPGQRNSERARKVLHYLRTGYWHAGERVHPGFVTNNSINHLRVYQYLSQFTAEKQVLDVGCGVGYGTALLAKTAARAVGIDISHAAIREAFRLCPTGEYLRMDAENMTFPGQSFDLIVSTENFEHLPNQAKHVRELARVVRPDGFCFVATPNPELFVGQNNPYHTKENTYSELRDLLSRCFREVEIVEPTRVPVNLWGARREKSGSRAENTERWSRRNSKFLDGR